MMIDYMLHKALDKIKQIIGIDNTKILIDIYDKLPDDITLKNPVTLMTCVKKDGIFFSLLFLEEALLEA